MRVHVHQTGHYCELAEIKQAIAVGRIDESLHHFGNLSIFNDDGHLRLQLITAAID